MTTRSSRATSVDGDNDPHESNATARSHLEHLALPTIQVQQHEWPSAVSFNSSLERMDEDVNDVRPQHPSWQRHSHKNVVATATHVEGTHHSSSQSTSQNVNSSISLMLNNEDGTIQQEALIHYQPFRNGGPSHLNDHSATIIAPPHSQPSHTDATTSSPPQTSTAARGSSSPSSQRPSSTTHLTPPNHVHDDHHRRRRRRLVRWLRRHVDHPFPWNLSLRQRTQNIRRRILDVDRVLP